MPLGLLSLLGFAPLVSLCPKIIAIDLERLIKNFVVRFGIELENALSLQPQTERGARE